MHKLTTHNAAQVLKTPLSAEESPRQSAAFFTPIGFVPMGGCAANKTPARREYARRLTTVLSTCPPRLKNGFSVSVRSKTMAHASIIQLPTASAVPVVNPRRRGAFPRGVLSFARYRREREYQQYLRDERARKINEARHNAAAWARHADAIAKGATA